MDSVTALQVILLICISPRHEQGLFHDSDIEKHGDLAPSPNSFLLHCHALGQVAGLVHVGAPEVGDMVSQ